MRLPAKLIWGFYFFEDANAGKLCLPAEPSEQYKRALRGLFCIRARIRKESVQATLTRELE
jgi:hypothetical protein